MLMALTKRSNPIILGPFFQLFFPTKVDPAQVTWQFVLLAPHHGNSTGYTHTINTRSQITWKKAGASKKGLFRITWWLECLNQGMIQAVGMYRQRVCSGWGGVSEATDCRVSWHTHTHSNCRAQGSIHPPQLLLKFFAGWDKKRSQKKKSFEKWR